MEKILIIEDDIWIANSLKLYLENSDFIALTYNSWEGALEKILEYKPNLVILDINLPVKNGIEIISELRKISDIPVIILTARWSENDKISGLENGADDYIAKPFSRRELLTRIKTILRRSHQNEDKSFVFQNLKLDLQKKSLEIDGKNIALTKNEYDLLERLLKENWKVISRETLMKEVMWYDNYMYDRTLDTHIKNLRKKLPNENMILTIRWEWYRLNK